LKKSESTISTKTTMISWSPSMNR